MYLYWRLWWSYQRCSSQPSRVLTLEGLMTLLETERALPRFSLFVVTILANHTSVALQKAIPSIPTVVSESIRDPCPRPPTPAPNPPAPPPPLPTSFWT